MAGNRERYFPHKANAAAEAVRTQPLSKKMFQAQNHHYVTAQTGEKLSLTTFLNKGHKDEQGKLPFS